MQEYSSTKLEVNKVKIGFTEKEMTSYGGFSILAKYFEKIQLRENIDKIVPVQESSPNRIEIYSKLIGYILILFAGGERFSHLLYLGSRKVLTKLFGIKRLPLASTTLTRLFNKLQSMAKVEKLSEGLWRYTEMLLPWEKMKEEWLTFDSTVIERYGKQEGARKGYNPKKKGRPSHNPLIAFLNKSKYVVQLWNRRGDARSSNNIIDFFKTAIERIGDKIFIVGIIADSGFYERAFIETLEKARKIYIIGARLYHTLQREVYARKEWRVIDEGISITEFYFKHEKWEKERRYIAVRQDITRREQAMGKQMKLFKEELKEYRYSVWVTSSKEDAYTIWNQCKPRANDENTIKELKEDFALGGFALDSFYATEAAMLMRIFVYNLFVLLREVILDQKEKVERLKTLRYKYFVLPAQLGKTGRDFILRISTQTNRIRSRFIHLFHNLEQYIPGNYGNRDAVGNIPRAT